MVNPIMKRPPLFSGLSDIHQALDRLFDHNLSDWEKDFPSLQITHWVPKIDIQEKDHQFIIKADLPGVNLKDTEVSLENGMLILKGKKETETKDEKEGYVRLERASGSFYRAISLPDVADASKITAKSKNGVLEIIVPKNTKSTSHKIQIREE